MEIFTRVLSGNSRLKERVIEAEQLNQSFKANLDNFKRLLESEESEDVLAVLDMVYDSSYPEEQVFMKTPSRARLKSKKEVVVRLLIGLDSLGVPAMAEMLAFVRKHGPEEVADSLMTVLELLSPLLEGKEAPDFSTDDVMDAIDFEWHSTSRVGSPLWNVIASSPARVSTASIGDSPLHSIMSASPYRRAKLVLDKASTASMPSRPSLTMSASSQYPSANEDFRFGQSTILEAPAPSLNDTLPAFSHRRSSSLQRLFMEDANDARRRNSSELITNTSRDNAVGGHDALKPLALELGLQSYSNGDVQEDARQAHSSQDPGHVDAHEELHADHNIHSSQEDGQFEKLLSELDAADGVVFCESGELPLIGNTGEKTQEETLSHVESQQQSDLNYPTFSFTLSHVESQQQSDLNQPATSSDPTMARWDVDTNVPRSKSKGGCMGKWARGCLSCCTKPYTNS